MGQAWNEEKINLLKRLWDDEGLSASEVGAQLGITRSAVIGKVHRLKLSSRKRAAPPPGTEAPWAAKRNAQRRARREKAKLAPRIETASGTVRAPQEPPPMAQIEGGIHIIDLEPHHCRAIIGTGDDGMARYCGDEKEATPLPNNKASSYCPGHGALYYNRIPR